MTAFAGAEDRAVHLDPRAKLEILGAILLALFLFALDQTVVGTALPVIVTDLHGNDLYTWVVTVYLLTSTISGPDLRQAVGPVRAAPDHHLRGRPVPGRVGAVRPEPGDVAADPVPRPPGPRRRRRLPGLARGRRRPVHAGRAGQVPRLLRGGLRPVVAAGSGDRWVHHRPVQLALDLLRQRPDRRGVAGDPVAPAAGDQAPGRRAATSTTSGRPCSPRRSGRSSSA